MGVTESFRNPLVAPGQRFDNGYTVGRDAGRLRVSSPTVVLQGRVETGTFQGPLQASRPDPGQEGTRSRRRQWRATHNSGSAASTARVATGIRLAGAHRRDPGRSHAMVAAGADRGDKAQHRVAGQRRTQRTALGTPGSGLGRAHRAGRNAHAAGGRAACAHRQPGQFRRHRADRRWPGGGGQPASGTRPADGAALRRPRGRRGCCRCPHRSCRRLEQRTARHRCTGNEGVDRWRTGALRWQS